MQAMPGPIDRGLLGADRIVTYTDGVAQRVEQEGQGRGSLIAAKAGLDTPSIEPWGD